MIINARLPHRGRESVRHADRRPRTAPASFVSTETAVSARPSAHQLGADTTLTEESQHGRISVARA